MKEFIVKKKKKKEEKTKEEERKTKPARCHVDLFQAVVAPGLFVAESQKALWIGL